MIVFITGANRGIGLYQTKSFLADGDTVFATYRSEEHVGPLVALGDDYPETLHLIKGEVTSDGDTGAFSSAVGAVASHLDILINNAGTDVEHHDPGLEEVPIEVILRTYDVNAVSMVRVSRALLPLLRKSERGGLVVNTSSGIGSMTNGIAMTRYGYMMSKAAVNILSRIMAYEFEKDGITTVAWSPGWVRTRLGTEKATYGLEEAGRMNVDVIKKITKADNGKWVDITGEILPY